ncbi:MAG: (2Fe-2S)-binding protein [Rhodobacteraceae bacterium]|nr:(2Fe-2S)-binding protein [Paracoccaceae bacterium]
MSLTQKIIFTLNGKPVQADAQVTASALELLRGAFELGGTKLACGEGECGACTIIVDGRSRNSCLLPAVDLDGREVLTVEGLWSEDGIDPVQQAFIDEGAIQCGFCTPGMIMQTKYLLSKNPRMTPEEIERGLEGNVCRCTGYKKIISAVAAASAVAAE